MNLNAWELDAVTAYLASPADRQPRATWRRRPSTECRGLKGSDLRSLVDTMHSWVACVDRSAWVSCISPCQLVFLIVGGLEAAAMKIQLVRRIWVSSRPVFNRHSAMRHDDDLFSGVRRCYLASPLIPLMTALETPRSRA